MISPQKKSKLRLYVTAAIIGIVVLFLISKGWSKLASNRSQIAPAGAENMITLTDSGFSPNNITIKEGVAIRWKNSSSAAASVNSDDYPTNRLYPELNLGKFEKNQTLVHVFTKAGTYKYHNQMRPQNTGTIIVQ